VDTETAVLCLICFGFGLAVGVGLAYLFLASPPATAPPTLTKPLRHSFAPLLRNIEEWKWVDWRGRERSILVRRELHQ